MARYPDTGSPFFTFSNVSESAFGNNANAGSPDGDRYILEYNDEFSARGGNGGGNNKNKDPGDPGGGEPVLYATYTSGDPAVDDSLEYNVTIEFYGDGWTTELMQAFIDGADFLSSVIDEDRPDYDPDADPNNFFDQPIDDILISASLVNIDGPGGVLGRAGPTHIIYDPSAGDTSSDALPFAGIMEFDIADAETFLASGQWSDIVMHEMMHVLGFGTLWERTGVVEMTIDDNGTRRPWDDTIDYNYLGLSATAENDGIAPEVEADGGSGTAGGHWDEVAYDNYLMTGYINDTNIFTSMSIGSLEDLGYNIDWAAADALLA